MCCTMCASRSSVSRSSVSKSLVTEQSWVGRAAVTQGLRGAKYGKLQMAMHAAMRPQGALEAKDVTIRAVEQGSRLLAVPPHGVRAVLQMPRGNLEGICPRVLVLAGIAAHLQVRLLQLLHLLMYTWG